MCVQRKVESHLPHNDEDDDGFEKVEDGASSPRCLMSYGAFFCLSVFFFASHPIARTRSKLDVQLT